MIVSLPQFPNTPTHLAGAAMSRWFDRKGASGFSPSSTADHVTRGVDGTGLTAIVTGASSGIGSETARILALRGVSVVMAVRDGEAGRQIRGEMVKENPEAKVRVMEVDLSSMASVRKFVMDFESSNLPLNILINNAGVMATPFTLSKDGIELQFAVNHLGHFLLTNLLLENMKRTALESGREGRIVNVSSRRHKFSYKEGIRFDKINDQAGYNSLSAYGQSKLANVLHSNELARKLKEDGAKVTANSVHPGAIYTNLFRYNNLFYGLASSIGKYFMKDIQQGAATTCYAALHPRVNGVSGCYFADSNAAETSSQASDPVLARKLWDFSLDLINRPSH